MTLLHNYADAEDIVVQWVKTTPAASLANGKVFLGMPKDTPVPSIILSRVGGSPLSRGDVPEDHARISFSCWAANRPQAKAIAKALVSEVDSLALAGYANSEGLLETGEIVSWRFFPDANSDTPRYIVDVIFVVVALN